MSYGDVTFGWVVRAVPDDLPEEMKATPTQAARSLLGVDERYIEATRPHFDTVWMADHFQWDANPLFEAFTTIAYLAGKYPGMRFGHLVLGQSYRNPALTAKMAGMMQLLTGGNFILGIGAGWKEDEYRGYGYDYPSAGVRIAQLEEAVQIIRAMWSDSPASFQGKHYRIENAYCEPRPDPPVPILIGGAGEKKTLRVVAKHADMWNHNFCNAEDYAHKQRVLVDHCRDVGRDPSEIVHTYRGLVSLVEEPTEAEKRDKLYVIGGTPEMVTRELEEFIKIGVRHFQLSFLDFPRTGGLETFIEKVLPRLKG
jgi:alkanesulfonate monooxygenase SsuD/methylene tetrahydromethanopterin reductase-like flavin-dependent oxidoreductase (luciferase family)